MLPLGLQLYRYFSFGGAFGTYLPDAKLACNETPTGLFRSWLTCLLGDPDIAAI
jgi:hypothetical protein